MAINNDTLYSDIYTAVKTVLLAASLTASGKSASVDASYNDKKQVSPQVIIEPVDDSEGPRYKFGNNQGKQTINISISAYYKTTKGVDELKQQIKVAMKANEFDDLMLKSIGVDNAFMNPNQAKYHSSTLTFTYDREV